VILLRFLDFLAWFSAIFTMPPCVAPINPPANTDFVFYFHPSDGPNSVVVTPSLNGSNFLAWSRSMRRALGAKNKLVFIDDSLPIPDLRDLNRSAWKRCNHLVHSWIINSVTEQIAQTLIFHENCIDAWEDLLEPFSKIDRIRIANLRSSINNLKRGSKSVLEHFTEMKMLGRSSIHIVQSLLALVHISVAVQLCVMLGSFALKIM
jgi:hypothetical protein